MEKKLYKSNTNKTLDGVCAGIGEYFNIDATVIAQAPKLKPYIPQMTENIAATLGVAVDSVNVKATTEEVLGFTGNLEGMACHAVCLLEKV